MKKLVKFCIMMFVFSLFLAVPISAEAKTPNKSVCTDSGWEALKSINEMRVKRGLVPLSVSERMYSGAKTRVKELDKKFSHIRPNGNSYRSVYANRKYIKNSKEGIAKDVIDEYAGIRALKRNSQDKRNMLSKKAVHFSTAYKKGKVVAMYSECDCTHTIKVVGSNKVINVPYGTSVEDWDLALQTSCKHGKGYVPVTRSMVKGVSKAVVRGDMKKSYNKQTIHVEWNGLKTTAKIKVVKRKLSDAEIVDAPKFVGWDGVPVDIEGDYKVTYMGKTLKKGVDYTVSYKNNNKEGQATLTITGKGIYTGKITHKFSVCKLTFIYVPRYY